MIKGFIDWTKSAGAFLVRNNITANLIVACLFLPAIAWLAAQRPGLDQGTMLVSLLIGMVIGLSSGLWFGWKWHDRKAKSPLGGIRYVAKGKYNQDLDDLRQSPTIDMIGISFGAFGKFREPVEEAYKNGAVIRVLLLDTTCPSFKEYVKKPAERQEIGLIGESAEAVEFLEQLQRKYERDAPPSPRRITIRHFDSIPYRGCIITNRTVHYWPYLHSEHPENTPTYFIEPESDVGKVLTTEFETIWDENKK